MLVTLEEMKGYLRIETNDEDALLSQLISAAERQCMDVCRTDEPEAFALEPNAKIAVMYAAAYLFEQRDEADHHAMNLTLRALLFGSRRESF